MKTDTHDLSGGRPAWVVFHGQADLPWLRFLKPGFRHCYLLLREGPHWISIDPMLNHMDINLHSHLPPDFDLPGWLEARGHTVVLAFTDRTHKKPAPWRLFTCVEAVKRILGLHTNFVLTPWQLYCHLTQPAHKKEITHHGKSYLSAQSFARSTT